MTTVVGGKGRFGGGTHVGQQRLTGTRRQSGAGNDGRGGRPFGSEGGGGARAAERGKRCPQRVRRGRGGLQLVQHQVRGGNERSDMAFAGHVVCAVAGGRHRDRHHLREAQGHFHGEGLHPGLRQHPDEHVLQRAEGGIGRVVRLAERGAVEGNWGGVGEDTNAHHILQRDGRRLGGADGGPRQAQGAEPPGGGGDRREGFRRRPRRGTVRDRADWGPPERNQVVEKEQDAAVERHGADPHHGRRRGD